MGQHLPKCPIRILETLCLYLAALQFSIKLARFILAPPFTKYAFEGIETNFRAVKTRGLELYTPFLNAWDRTRGRQHISSSAVILKFTRT